MSTSLIHPPSPYQTLAMEELGMLEEAEEEEPHEASSDAEHPREENRNQNTSVAGLLQNLPYLWGRDDQKIFYYEVNSFKSRRATTTLPGRAWFDTLTWSKKEDGSEVSYKLKHLAEAYMKNGESDEYKQDLHWTQILPKARGTDEDRAELASYCIQDNICCIRHADVRLAFIKSFASARGSFMNFGTYFYSTAQAQDYNCIIALGLQEKCFIPWCLSPYLESDSYMGGKVFDIIPGYWPQYVGTIDATSLYPTVMIAHHLCATNLVVPERRTLYAPEDLETCPSGHTYLKREGIGARLLKNGIKRRNEYKAKMKAAKARDDIASYVAYDAGNLAEKLKLNTWYGMKGASVKKGGKLPCSPLAESTCSWGRWHITELADMIKEFFPQIQQIGGDTDSVIIAIDAKKHGINEEGMLRLGRDVVSMINKRLTPPMSFAFENVFEGLVYVAKKNYAGSHRLVSGNVLMPPLDAGDAMKIKGMACVRKNFPPIICDVQWHMLRVIFNLPPFSRVGCVLPPPPEGLFHVCGSIQDRVIVGLTFYAQQIAQDKIPLDGYAVSAELSQEEYKGSPPHARVAEKARKRSPEDAPKVGDRVVYFWCKVSGKPEPCDATEIRIRGLCLDRPKYMSMFIKTHLSVFGHIVDPNDLHARLSAILIQPTKLLATSPFAAFLIKK